MDEAPLYDHGHYVDGDAAYVLGSLSREERLDYERHLEACQRCQNAVNGLVALPGLLAKLDSDEALAILNEGAAPQPLPLEPPRRRHVSVRVLAGAVAVAAVVLVAVLVPILGSDQSPASVTAVSLSQTVPNPLSATVALTKASWGTRVDMTCTYAAGSSGSAETYNLYVLDRSGHASLVSSWRAGPGDVAHTQGSTDLSPSEIAAVQVRDKGGSVLLASSTSGRSTG